jgi:uncharacterized protein YidB (DUF937 family)
MDFYKLLRLGAQLIRDNDDPATTGLDTDAIVSALGSLFGDEGSGTPDLGSLVEKAMQGGLGDVVQSWLGQGENLPLSPEQVTNIVDGGQVAQFAQKLGVSEESAKKALADALPRIVDEATPAGSDTLTALMERMGGMQGAMNMLGGLFR